ncbi:MAG: nuclear transport factor 2 family protein [Rhizobiaceae bacterium]|nr:nuclear transport factor 2 family protein [Rhizobiaceae bacterium]
MDEEFIQKNKLTVRRLFYELMNKQNLLLANEIFNVRLQANLNDFSIEGRSAFLKVLKKYLRDFPALHYEVLSVFGEGDMVCAHWKLITRLEEGDMVVPSTGITVFRFRIGKIVQLDQQWNNRRLQLPANE